MAQDVSGGPARRAVNRSGAEILSRPLIAAVLFIFALFIPLLTNEYTQYIVNLMLVYILVTVGFNILIGNLGQLAFSNVAFFGIGAYTTGILMHHLGLPYWATILPAAIVGGLAGFLASVPALRGIRALYLAIMTLAFGELMRWLYVHGGDLTLGSTGLPVPASSIFWIPLRSATAKFYLFLVIVSLVLLATSNLLRSRFGRAIVAIKDNELATASLGVNTARHIVLAFVWSGLVVSIAGSMYAILIGRVVPESFNLIQLIQHFAMVMVGGVGSLAGSVLGAVTLTWAPELFRGFPGFEELFLGLLIVAVLLFLPYGLIAVVIKILPSLKERYYRE